MGAHEAEAFAILKVKAHHARIVNAVRVSSAFPGNGRIERGEDCRRVAHEAMRHEIDIEIVPGDRARVIDAVG